VSETERSGTAEDAPLPGGDFRLLVQRLAYQALIAFGVLQNPITGNQEADVDRARALLDDLRMLREKTAGNLEPDEAEHLDRVLADLEHRIQPKT
jgi:hypothetical protein